MRLFYCYAVPRSGTSYFANLLDSHRQILCGHERFSPQGLTRDALSKEGFLNFEKSRADIAKLDASISEKQALIAVGDKFPRAYLHTQQVFAEISDAKFFIIMRNPRNVAASWNVRAANPQDSWPTGMVSAFANLEMIFCIFSLFQMPDTISCCVLNYEFLVDPQTLGECAGALAGILGTTPDREMLGFLEKTKTRRRGAGSGAVLESDEQFYTLPCVQKFFSAAATWKIENRAIVMKSTRDFVSDFRKNESVVLDVLGRNLREWFAVTPEAKSYFQQMRSTYLAAARTLRLAQFLNSLQQLAS